MIAVDSITEQELDKRFDTLPSKLKEALTSERVLSVVDQICEKNKIAEQEKVLMVHQLVGLTILGLVHSYDLGSEINEALSLDNPKFSNAIAEELDAKIFSPIKAELESNYHPITTASLEKKAAAAEAPAIPKSIPNPAPVSPKPSILSDVGWSKMPPPAPAPSLIPAPAAKINSVPVPAPMAAPAAAPKPAAEPAPVMLHQDTTFKAAEKNAGFTLSRPQAGAEMKMGAGGGQAPTRPAVLEFGGIKPAAPQPSRPVTPGNQAMHYTDLKPSLSSAPTASAGPRNVSQIMPGAPAVIPVPKPPASAPASLQAQKPSAPPTPPMPPKPPAAPTAPQTNKPIVKDFL